jgi:surface protein
LKNITSKYVINENTTTVTIYWDSYTNIDNNDGLSLNQSIVNYGTVSSLNIKQFGGIPLPNMTTSGNGSFNGFAGIISAIDVPSILNTSLSYCFMNSTTSHFGNIASWKVQNVVNMSGMFLNAVKFNVNINNWRVTNVTTMYSMFNGAISFNQPLNNWNVLNVTTMESMFNGAASFNQPLTNWNVSNVVNMISMFQYAYSFNQNLNSWNMSSLLFISKMFNNAVSFNSNISRWDVSKINDFQNDSSSVYALFYEKNEGL